MTKVPDLNLPDRKFGKWIPDKKEVYDMRYWKAKKATPKPVKPHKNYKPKKAKPIDKTLFGQDHDHIQHLRSIQNEQ